MRRSMVQLLRLLPSRLIWRMHSSTVLWLHLLSFKTELKDAQFVDLVASSSGFETESKDAQFCEAGAKSGFKTPRSRGLMVASSGPLRCVDPGKGDAGHLGRRRPFA